MRLRRVTAITQIFKSPSLRKSQMIKLYASLQRKTNAGHGLKTSKKVIFLRMGF
jgi:hypothetical protein